jgi:hypothetical protein
MFRTAAGGRNVEVLGADSSDGREDTVIYFEAFVPRM